MLCWSRQRSCTTEPVTAPLGTSQDGVCGGTSSQRNKGIRATSTRGNTPHSGAAAVPSTVRVTLVSPKLTLSNGALISQRYSPASSWVTLFKVTVAPSMVARPSKEPKGRGRRAGKEGSFPASAKATAAPSHSRLKHFSDLFAALVSSF